MNVRMQQGKPAYSLVVTVIGPAKMIYIAGQLARDVDGNIVGPGDMRLQLEQTFKKPLTPPSNRRRYLGRCCQDQHVRHRLSGVLAVLGRRMRYFEVGGPTSTTIQISGSASPRGAHRALDLLVSQ
jgi:2-iminobutanoate/2-iminopropanoate deaminase